MNDDRGAIPFNCLYGFLKRIDMFGRLVCKYIYWYLPPKYERKIFFSVAIYIVNF